MLEGLANYSPQAKATPIQLCIVYGGFVTTMAQLSDCVTETTWLEVKNVYYLAFKKSLPTPGFNYILYIVERKSEKFLNGAMQYPSLF